MAKKQKRIARLSRRKVEASKAKAPKKSTKVKAPKNDVLLRLKSLEKENRALAQQVADAQEDQLRFINLLVTSQRLSASLDVRETLQIINEITINLVGSEQFGLYFIKGDESSQPLELVCEVFETGSLAEPPVINPEKLKGALQNGRVQIFESKDGAVRDADTPLAVIPLHMGKERLGALVLYSFLPHKKGFTKIDLEILDLLGSAAARAFYTAMLHAKGGLPGDLPVLLKQSLMVDNRF